MSAATTVTGPPTSGGAEQQLGYELGRYSLPDGERILYGTRANRAAIVIDAPAGDDGRIYLVERDVEQDGYGALKSLIADYISVATAIRRIPMARRAVPEVPETGS
jgi:hypothetical protein